MSINYFEKLKRIPMIRLLLPLIAGIVIQYNSPLPTFIIWPVSLFLFSLLILSRFTGSVYGNYSFSWLYGVTINLLILFLAMGLTSNQMQPPSFLGYSDKSGFVVARVLESPREREKWIRVVAEPVYIVKGDTIFKTSGKALLWIEKDSCHTRLGTGDRIVMPNRFNETRNPGNPFEFDYRHFLRVQGISAESYLTAGSWYIAATATDKKLSILAERLRNYLLGVVGDSGIEGREYAVAGALILGYRSDLDQEIRQSFADSGAMHILAVSGLHVGILYLFLLWVLGFINHIRYFPVIRLAIILIIIWSYAFLTGLSPSVTRAATMFSFMAVAISLNRRTNIYNTLALSAFIQLIIAPFSVFMVGFQLSYLAVAGISYYQPLIYPLFKGRTVLAEKVWAIITVSISAQILIFPLILYYFNQFPNYFLITNLFAIPLAMAILYSGLLLFLISPVPVVSSIIATVLNFSLMAVNFLTGKISQLPFSIFSGITITTVELIIIYGIVVFITAFFVGKKPVYLILTIIIATGGLASRAENRISRADQSLFIVYNSGNNPLYSFVSGNDHYIISGVEISSGSVPYAASGAAQRFKNVSMPDAAEFFSSGQEFEIGRIYVNNKFVVIDDYSILFACDDEIREPLGDEPFFVDLLVISFCYSTDISLIFQSISPGKVVFDSSVPYFRKLKMIETCLVEGIDYHDVKTGGALVVRI
jgi:competence protein ComEC